MATDDVSTAAGAPSARPQLAEGWRWQYGDAEGNPVATSYRPSPAFGSQADAESWVGELWRDLVSAGVDTVTLTVEDRVVYGPMSLHPVAQ